jgi:DNA-binding transcriptional regulator YhcF (GntR family)
MDAVLAQLAQALYQWVPAHEDDWPTAMMLSKQLKLKPETVKKKLRLLQQWGLIQPISVSPKRYRFDHYIWNHLSLEDPRRTVILEASEETLDALDPA